MDTLSPRLHPEFLGCINITFSDEEIHYQFIHVFFPNLYVVKLLLPLFPCNDFL